MQLSVRPTLIGFMYYRAGVQGKEQPISLGLAREGFQKSVSSLKRYTADRLVDRDRKDSVQRQRGMMLATGSSSQVAGEFKGCDTNAG